MGSSMLDVTATRNTLPTLYLTLHTQAGQTPQSILALMLAAQPDTPLLVPNQEMTVSAAIQCSGKPMDL